MMKLARPSARTLILPLGAGEGNQGSERRMRHSARKSVRGSRLNRALTALAAASAKATRKIAGRLASATVG